MEILNLGNGSEDSPATTRKSKRSKASKAAIGIGALATVTGLGSTLAAQITLNSGNNVEFGQGVAQTAACDEDGFTITPVSYYDTNSSTFRLDYVQVSGLNLTPMGENYLSDSSVSYADQSAAMTAHPGQYFDTEENTWLNTCDQVVLDFKAYTDSSAFSTNTIDGYAELEESSGESIPTTTSSPLFWQVDGNGGVANLNHVGHASAFAIIFDSTHEDSNYAVPGQNGDALYMAVTWPAGSYPGVTGTGFVKESSFQFFADYGHHAAALWGDNDDNVDPIAGAISMITVESMKYFPSDYYDVDQYFDQMYNDGYAWPWLGSNAPDPNA